MPLADPTAKVARFLFKSNEGVLISTVEKAYDDELGVAARQAMVRYDTVRYIPGSCCAPSVSAESAIVACTHAGRQEGQLPQRPLRPALALA